MVIKFVNTLFFSMHGNKIRKMCVTALCLGAEILSSLLKTVVGLSLIKDLFIKLEWV